MKTIKLILLFASVALIANSCSNSTSPNTNNKGFASALYECHENFVQCK
jgi:hypothetical protein